MDTQDIINLIKTIDTTSIETVEIEKNSTKILISKANTREKSIEKEETLTENLPIEEDVEEIESEEEDIFLVRSPVVGVFYQSPNPDEESFVQLGDNVEEGDILCIVEAMKIMNEIESEISGEVVDILVEDEDVVEYGQPLMRIRR